MTLLVLVGILLCFFGLLFEILEHLLQLGLGLVHILLRSSPLEVVLSILILLIEL